MKKFLLILTVVVSFGYDTFAQKANTQIITNLSAERFKAIIAYDKVGVLLDLRSTEEMNKGFIKDAVHLDFSAPDAEKQIDKLDKQKTYYLYCTSGILSYDAAVYMEKQGFKRIYNFEKGFSEWENKGFPVEKK